MVDLHGNSKSALFASSSHGSTNGVRKRRKKHSLGIGAVVRIYNPSYFGQRNREVHSSRPAQAKSY
jgi:hypothetical protein